MLLIIFFVFSVISDNGSLVSSLHKFNKEAAYFTGPGLDSINKALWSKDNLRLIFNYDTEDYISSISIKKNLDLVFSISYKEYKKKWAYDLKCVSLKKD